MIMNIIIYEIYEIVNCIVNSLPNCMARVEYTISSTHKRQECDDQPIEFPLIHFISS